MHIYLGADHRGFALKTDIVNWLTSRQITFTDFGATVFDAEDDYNDYAKKVVEALLADHKPDSFGILVCGSAQGMAMQANRYKGIRAAIGYDAAAAMEARSHNDANIICIPADDIEYGFADILDAFISGKPFPDEKYQRRNKKLDEI